MVRRQPHYEAGMAPGVWRRGREGAELQCWLCSMLGRLGSRDTHDQKRVARVMRKGSGGRSGSVRVSKVNDRWDPRVSLYRQALTFGSQGSRSPSTRDQTCHAACLALRSAPLDDPDGLMGTRRSEWRVEQAKPGAAGDLYFDGDSDNQLPPKGQANTGTDHGLRSTGPYCHRRSIRHRPYHHARPCRATQPLYVIRAA